MKSTVCVLTFSPAAKLKSTDCSATFVPAGLSNLTLTFFFSASPAGFAIST
ncbi:hypothetical protein EVA_03018 [gut metagenome]|uniref:Uncharacterized protein n=1 Tax=gut metagenome TaxID=749906 RepID=J9GZV9_9ZZZZ